MIEKMFENATREKMRFPYKGEQPVEALWDMSVQVLDGIFKTLNSQVKQKSEESLLSVKKEDKEDVILNTKIEIVKHIVSVKLQEAALRDQAKEQKEKKNKILSILSDKQEESLKNKSEEELQKMLEEL